MTIPPHRSWEPVAAPANPDVLRMRKTEAIGGRTFIFYLPDRFGDEYRRTVFDAAAREEWHVLRETSG